MSPADWSLVVLGAFLVGLGKGGVVGVGNFTIILFAMVFGAKASVGILLPVLIAADLVAITVYRRHANWYYLRLLMPWMVVGTLVGYVLFSRMDALLIQRLIGAIVLSMTLLQVVLSGMKRAGGGDWADKVPHSRLFRSGLGVLGGFATMVANAAGPIGQLYFISVGLPKMAFIGTGAWCFFLINVFKLPLQAQLGILHFGSLQTSLLLAPAAIAGALLAPRIVKWIPQQLFSWAVWIFIVVGGLKLLLF